MIIVRFQGRLGNQIFQYAFARSLAKRFGTHYLLDNTENSQLLKYFRIFQVARWGKLNKWLLGYFRKSELPVFIQSGHEDIEELSEQFANNLYYKGFFQSETYFFNVKEMVKKSLVIKKCYQKVFCQKFGKLFKNDKILAIHCRLGDYMHIWEGEALGGQDLTLPASYYKNALGKIDNIEDYKIIIVTDDKLNAESRFEFIKEKTIVSEDDIIDFQVLQNADKLIISNSSFSWWAAYLNTKSAPVYAPEYWLGFKVKKEWPAGIMPTNFISVSFQ